MAGKIVVGIAGGSGSGKTTFCQQLQEHIGAESVTTLQHDAYYRDLSHLPESDRAATNFDDPQALESELLVDHLQQLLAGRDVKCPRYDFANHSRKESGAVLTAKPVILIEGVLVFTHATLRDICHLRIFLDATENVRYQRRRSRDRELRGRSDDSIREQWRQTVKPMHDLHVEPSKDWAHIIVPAAEPNQKAVELVSGYLNAVLDSQKP